MTLYEKTLPIRSSYNKLIFGFFETLAWVFGYPENPGIPVEQVLNRSPEEERFINLPIRTHRWPPVQRPETWIETVFGPVPKTNTIDKHFFETKKDGFYNFYVHNYQNIVFLPDWLSKFLQIKLGICLDTSILEMTRGSLFILVVVFTQMLVFRVALAWFLTVNPYAFPWYYFSAIIDWAEELCTGAVPTILSVNINGPVVLAILGATGDILNNLIFTMPFLPSEGVPEEFYGNNLYPIDVIMFRNLPVLWAEYPIPNDIREFWHANRPDILEYMSHTYKDLNIQFLPESVLSQLKPRLLDLKMLLK